MKPRVLAVLGPTAACLAGCAAQSSATSQVGASPSAARSAAAAVIAQPQPQPPPAGFPTGKYTTTITTADNNGNLVGPWVLSLDTSGTYELSGAEFSLAGIYTVSGTTLTILETTNSQCELPSTPGTYAWRFDGRAITLSATATADTCGEGGRTFHMTTHPWTLVSASTSVLPTPTQP